MDSLDSLDSKNDSEKNPQIFICKNCDFKCSKHRDYQRHLATQKHKRGINDSTDSKNMWICECGKQYKYDIVPAGSCGPQFEPAPKSSSNNNCPVVFMVEKLMQFESSSRSVIPSLSSSRSLRSDTPSQS